MEKTIPFSYQLFWLGITEWVIFGMALPFNIILGFYAGISCILLTSSSLALNKFERKCSKSHAKDARNYSSH